MQDWLAYPHLSPGDVWEDGRGQVEGKWGYNWYVFGTCPICHVWTKVSLNAHFFLAWLLDRSLLAPDKEKCCSPSLLPLGWDHYIQQLETFFFSFFWGNIPVCRSIMELGQLPPQVLKG